MRPSSLRSLAAACSWIVLVAAAQSYRSVEPLPRVRLDVPAHWLEHRREGDVVYAPSGVDHRSRSLSHGVRVFLVDAATTNVARQLETQMSAYQKANPGMKADGPYQVEPGLNRAVATFSNVPPDDPTSRETGWLLVARYANGRWLCLFAVSQEAERPRTAEAFSHMRASLQVRER